MIFSSVISLACFALGSFALPEGLDSRAAPTIYLVGDSTMAAKGANNGRTDGWGQYLSKYVTATVVNKAIAGRSARSYSNEGRFNDLARIVEAGDIVVIEFGHNDGGSSTSAADNARSDCPGTGEETCKSGKTGETVYTYGHYIKAAARTFTAKGAKVVISSQTPNNLWEGGHYSAAPSKFVQYAATASKDLGTGSTSFVDHFQAVANMYKKLGSSATNALYPSDHTHTSPKGADLSAQAFAQAIKVALNGSTPIALYLKAGNPTVWRSRDDA